MKYCLFLCMVVLFFSACGTKRQYYKPEKISSSLSYDSRLKSSINSSNLNYAKLNNNQVIGENGVIENFKLERGYELLKYEAGEFVVADENGNLKIYDEEANELYVHKFNAAVLALALEGDDLALILADNTIVLANRSLGIKMSQTLTPAPAQDKRFAPPYFLSSIIVYPSLDGKLNIVDKNSQKIIRSIVVGSEDFFNTIIYFKIFKDKMIAASAKKLIVVDTHHTFFLDEDIKNIEIHGDFIFIFAKNGNIIKTDLSLNKLIEKKFNFALYNESQIFNGHIYVFEKTGYLIKTDLNLENIEVFRLKNAVGKKAFMKEGKFYYSNKILNLL